MQEIILSQAENPEAIQKFNYVWLKTFDTANDTESKKINVSLRENICSAFDEGFNIHDILRFLSIHGESLII